MATTDFIAAIELRSTKMTGIVGKNNSDGSVRVLAYAQREAHSFIRKGVVYNIDKASAAIQSIVKELEEQVGEKLSKVYVGTCGQSVCTMKNSVRRELPQEEIISQELVDGICDENLTKVYDERDILDVIPQEYEIDNIFQKEAVGVAGKDVVGHFLNITAKKSLKKNLETSFEQAGVEIADLLLAPLASAKAMLSDMEMKNGCALVDIGAETTTVMVYKKNILRYMSVIPIGGSAITKDLTTLRLEEEVAERYKREHGDAKYIHEAGEEKKKITTEEGKVIYLEEFNDIVEARMEEILANVWEQLKRSGYEDRLLGGVTFTGGGARLKNLKVLFEKFNKTLITKINVNTLIKVVGFEDELSKGNNEYSLFGLLTMGNENCCCQEEEKVIEEPVVEEPAPAPEAEQKEVKPEDDPELSQPVEKQEELPFEETEEEKRAREALEEQIRERERLAEERKLKEEEAKKAKKESGKKNKEKTNTYGGLGVRITKWLFPEEEDNNK